ncbi:MULTISPECIES: beta-carotene ketolase CrtO [unclassified Leptolyngbya]|uniref:beta-carotene ketolase CrtO n=1 Tax=unclassified Leptolyngbya TaxID=2650499 RepID=UPI001685F96A|nr:MULTISPECIES: NAD(P)/FAD-dependent oxidoreductase [unclassified Leptolyngbya]MBD1911325.1 NAD(P)/FAD-dependent oxidoreductase [Leptolyngbya sp. FACHB-8]MBD2156657.1 NAD(P)/FAD-dependent oxidoreductase [Leptolyngbya sp. FACHB-16]
MQDYDVIIIGAGHNGLVCAGYLLKAGYRVLLLEKRSIPGGAATTEESLPDEAPGFYFNLCAIDHEFIHLGPVVNELELEKYGLEYLFCDPVLFCPQPDGKYFLGHRSIEKTCAEIARYNQRDAEKYGEYMAFWDQLVQAITPVFNAPPKSVIDILGNYGLHNMQDLLGLVGGVDKALDLIRTMLTSPKDSLNEWFDTELVKAPLARLASELGAPPSQKTIAIGGMMMGLRHNPGMARPRGGTGALTRALVNMVQDHGGTILCDQHVERLLINNQGHVDGVRVAGGQEYRASKAVISNIDAQRLFLELLDPEDARAIAPKLYERLERRIVNNNDAILKIDCALSEAPRFEAYGHRDEFLIGSVVIADSLMQVEDAHSLPEMGRIPDADPSMYVVVPTMRDPSMAPEGKHTLWIEFFAPYQIRDAEGTGHQGTGWTDELKNQVADRVMDKLAQYAPNVKDAVIARRVESPPELSDRLGVYKGNHYHIDMTLDQMVFFRPLPEIANYKTPIEGLYLTGAGTHPGGSISGLPGRNCARVFLNTQQPITQNLKEAGNWLKTRFEAIAKIPHSH